MFSTCPEGLHCVGGVCIVCQKLVRAFSYYGLYATSLKKHRVDGRHYVKHVLTGRGAHKPYVGILEPVHLNVQCVLFPASSMKKKKNTDTTPSPSCVTNIFICALYRRYIIPSLLICAQCSDQMICYSRQIMHNEKKSWTARLSQRERNMSVSQFLKI
jgi:hypothetical protein